jgi:hypothetical protein
MWPRNVFNIMKFHPSAVGVQQLKKNAELRTPQLSIRFKTHQPCPCAYLGAVARKSGDRRYFEFLNARSQKCCVTEAPFESGLRYVKRSLIHYNLWQKLTLNRSHARIREPTKNIYFFFCL